MKPEQLNQIIVLLLQSYGPIVFSGIASACIDVQASTSSWKSWAMLFMAVLWPGKGSQRATAMIYSILRLAGLCIRYDNFTEFFICWYSLKFIPPMLDYVIQDNTELVFLEGSAHSEHSLRLFLIANVLTRACFLGWRVYLLLTLTGICFYGILKVLPQTLKNKVVVLGLRVYLYTFRRAFDEDYSLRRLVILVSDPAQAALEDWERKRVAINKAKTRTDAVPYEYGQMSWPREIRLLRIHRKKLAREPVCSLEHCLLDEAPNFEALSYCWRTQTKLVPLNIDGRELLVGEAVADFIWRHRSLLWDKYVWIDAVCINQGDDAEKSIQVQMMRDIYARSSRVIVWLHTPTPPTHLMEVRLMIKWLWMENIFKQPVWGSMNRLYDTQEKAFIAFTALRHFYSHPWFERVWIIQEVSMATKVHIFYGGFRADWSLINLATEAISSNRTFNNTLFNSNHFLQTVDDMTGSSHARDLDFDEQPKFHNILNINLVREKKQYLTLSSLLTLCTTFKATNWRDKIFALIALSTDSAALLPRIDYTKPIEDVFLEAATFILQSRDWANVLYFAGRGYRAIPNPDPDLFGPQLTLPSWVPLWSAERAVGAYSPDPAGLYSSMLQEEPLHRPVLLTEHPNQISINAILVDSVQHMGPDRPIRVMPSHIDRSADLASNPLGGLKPIATWFLDMQVFARQNVTAATIRAGGESAVDEAVWHTLMSGSARRDTEYLATTREAWMKFLALLDEPDFSAESLRLSNSIPEILQGNLSRSVTGKRLGVTASGVPALVPLDTKEGDVVVYIQGLLTPFLLRPFRDVTYELVGACYVYGAEGKAIGTDWQRVLLE